MQQNVKNLISTVNSKEVPDEFICPITQDIMSDPVIDKDGVSYEKQAIINWIKSKGGSAFSPMDSTRKIYENDLIPNRALKTQIENFKQTYPVHHIGQLNKPLQQIDSDLVVDIKLKQHENNLFFSMKAISATKRMPVHIVAIVDISGSMDTEVSVLNSSGVSESNGLSRLDIVKHALNTIVETLNENDCFSVVTFSNQGNVLIEKQKITVVNKQTILNKIKNLKPYGGTNLWDGVKCAIDIISQTQHTGHINSLFLLTDGQPTVEPPRGHETMLLNKLKQLGPKCVLNTFGFGYDLDSSLLSNMAKIGNGFYSFIPDAGFVGTIFINALSNLLLSYATHGSITINYTDNSSDTVNFDMSKYELTRLTTINIGRNKIFNIKVSYVNPITLELTEQTFNNDDIEYILDQGSLMDVMVRHKFCEILNKSLQSHSLVQQDLQEFIKHIELIQNKTPLINGILQDAKGQVSEALSSPTYFNKWGKHYLRSLLMAHSQQNCNNFKDPGVQCYSTPEFEILRNNIDDIFSKIPPPTPSKTLRSNTFGSTPPTIQNMSAYNNVDNGCFAGECVVLTLNGPKFVKDINVGDYVETGNKNRPYARVKNVLKISLENKPVNMTKFRSGLMITNWHPIFVETPKKYNIVITDKNMIFSPVNEGFFTWNFPKHLSLATPKVETTLNSCSDMIYNGEAMYDFVLDNTHTININGIICVTLGHNFTENVVKHEYFGSQKVVYDIHKLSVNGYATITRDFFTRSTTTNQINGIIKPVKLNTTNKWHKLVNNLINKYNNLSKWHMLVHKLNKKNNKRQIDYIDYKSNKKLKTFDF